MKVCNKCLTSKPLIEFYKNRGSCIACVKNQHAIYRNNNIDKIKQYSGENREKLNEYKRIHRKNNPEKHKKDKAEYRAKNHDKILEQERLLHIKNKEKRNESARLYYVKNKEKILKYRSEYKKQWKAIKLETDPYFKLVSLIRCAVYYGFKLYSKNGKTKSCAEYGIDFKSIFDAIGPRPSDDYHLDHIIPISKFNLDIPEHVRLAHMPCNLRWISSFENISKNDKILIELFNQDLKEIATIIGLDLT